MTLLEQQLKLAVLQTDKVLRGKAVRVVHRAKLLEENRRPRVGRRQMERNVGFKRANTGSYRGVLALWGDGKERNISESWQYLFATNKYRGWTDGQLLTAINRFFPGRRRGGIWEVKHIRAKYNRGVLCGMKGPPPERSVRYETFGHETYEVGSRGRLVGLAPDCVRFAEADDFQGIEFEEVVIRQPVICRHCLKSMELHERGLREKCNSRVKRWLHKSCAIKLYVVWKLIPLLDWKRVGPLKWETRSQGRIFTILKDRKSELYGCIEYGRVFNLCGDLATAQCRVEEEADREI